MGKYCSHWGMEYKAFFMSINKNLRTWLLIANTAASQSEAILKIILIINIASNMAFS